AFQQGQVPLSLDPNGTLRQTADATVKKLSERRHAAFDASRLGPAAKRVALEQAILRQSDPVSLGPLSAKEVKKPSVPAVAPKKPLRALSFADEDDSETDAAPEQPAPHALAES